MSVPDGQIVPYHLERCVENGLIPLRLPELDVEAICLIADPSVRFPDLSHGCMSFTAIKDNSLPPARSQR
jgi:hypothetical protein